jgi:hypothetical protein
MTTSSRTIPNQVIRKKTDWPGEQTWALQGLWERLAIPDRNSLACSSYQLAWQVKQFEGYAPNSLGYPVARTVC